MHADEFKKLLASAKKPNKATHMADCPYTKKTDVAEGEFDQCDSEVKTLSGQRQHYSQTKILSAD
jgi:hypothetical protein